MMLGRGQWMLGEVVFGRGTPYQIETVEETAHGITASDYQIPGSDEYRFGRDFLQPGSLNFTLGVVDNRILPQFAGLATPEQKAQAVGAEILAEQLRMIWDNNSGNEGRSVWGTTMPLFLCGEDNIDKMVVGRPRKFFAGRKGRKGEFIPVAMEFQRADPYAYAVEPVELEAGVAPGPNSTNLDVRRPYIQDGGGGAKAWCEVYIQGPITNPKVQFGYDKVLEVDYTVAADEMIYFSSFPWNRGFWSSAGVNLSSRLVGQSAYLDQLFLRPQQWTGIGVYGTFTNENTKLMVMYREAYNTL